MPRKAPGPPRTTSAEIESWKEAYEVTPYEDLPWFQHEPSFQVSLAIQERFLPAGGRVLDLGCGAGSNVLHLASEGFVAHGLDLSPGALRAARDRAMEARLPARLIRGDAVALPFRDQVLDAVTDNGCFHTLPFELRKSYAHEVWRVLRPEGRYVLAWVGRETTTAQGPPHRPSLGEVVEVFEDLFLFHRTGIRRDTENAGWTMYFAWMARRSQPPPARR